MKAGLTAWSGDGFCGDALDRLSDRTGAGACRIGPLAYIGGEIARQGRDRAEHAKPQGIQGRRFGHQGVMDTRAQQASTRASVLAAVPV